MKTLAAVEPSSGMRAAFEKGLAKVPKQDLEGKNVITVDGGFDDFSNSGVAKGEADAVVIAQAFHWCPDYQKALVSCGFGRAGRRTKADMRQTEIAEYLKPGAPLILIWNLEQNQDEWHQALRDLYQPLDQGSPQYYRGGWKKLYDTDAYKSLFEPAQIEQFPWHMGMTEEGIRDRIFSKSYLTENNLKGQEREDFEKKLRQLIASDGPGKEYIDKDAGIIKYRYNTDLVIMRKRK